MSAPGLVARVRGGRLGIGPHIAVVLLLLGLVGAMAITPTRELLQQRHRVADVSRDLSQLERSNRRLEARIAKLNDPDYLDQLARKEIGLVKPGETSYVVMPPSRSHRTARRRPDPAARPRRTRPTFIQRVLHFVGVD